MISSLVHHKCMSGPVYLSTGITCVGHTGYVAGFNVIDDTSDCPLFSTNVANSCGSSSLTPFENYRTLRHHRLDLLIKIFICAADALI